jgi:pyrroline-5-carboxylate reductase
MHDPAQARPIYGIIGVGAIATAIVDGLCAEGDVPAICLSPRNATRAAALAERHSSVRICADNQAVLAQASIVLLCVRPQDAAQVLGGLAFRADQTIISVMAGLSIAQLAPMVAPATDICRTIPLIAVAVRKGITPVYPQNPTAKAIFDRLGGALELADEASFDALSAASGTVAAYFSYLGAISDWVAAQGIPAAAADRYVASIFAGLGDSLNSGERLSHLARDHATPGGINEMFNAHLRESGLIDDVTTGLDRVLDRLSGRKREH